MGKLKMTAKVVSQETLATDVYSLVLEAPDIAAQAIAGQFVSVYTHDGSKMLPRPISLCGIDREAGTLRLVYRVVGFGTKEFSQLVAGDTVDILGPLGNGFMKSDKKAILIGGGIVAAGTGVVSIPADSRTGGGLRIVVHKVMTELVNPVSLRIGTVSA